MMNPIPRDYILSTPELTPIFDAFEEMDDQAFGMIVGLPCTYDNGRDRYAGKVISASASEIVVDMGNLGKMTFRQRNNKTGIGWMPVGWHWVGWLMVGEANPYTERDA
jgi:hypothetical protein